MYRFMEQLKELAARQGPPGQTESTLGAGVGFHSSGDGLGQPAWHLHVGLLLQGLQHGRHALEQIPEGGHGVSSVAICRAQPSDMSLTVATVADRPISPEVPTVVVLCRQAGYQAARTN